jgi:nucleotide-binding universal stress UspA family protein
MYAKILVPLDGSTFAEAAIGPAIGIAEKARGRICLLAVESSADEAAHWLEPSMPSADAKHYLRDVLIRFRPVTSIPMMITVLRAPAAAEAIVAEAAMHDLIVMTSHGRGGLARALFGSVADECVRTSSTPVLVVRPVESGPASLRLEVSKIVVPLDGSALAESVLPAAAQFASLLDVPMTLVRSVALPLTNPVGYVPVPDAIPPDPTAPIEEAHDYLERVASTRLSKLDGPPTLRVTLGPDAARDICEAAGPDGFIAMATHGMSGIRRALLGSVTDRVIRSAPSVVLVMRPSGRTGGKTADRYEDLGRALAGHAPRVWEA